MVTESPVRMVQSAGTRKWSTFKDIATFDPHIKSMAEEEFEVLLNGWKAQTDTIPSRSGSAPPSMEGSFAAIGNILARQNLGISSSLESLGREIGNFESEEELRSDPAYFAYYCSNVNLNPRFRPHIMSSENRRLVHHIGGFGNHWKSASSNEAKNMSFQLPKGSLPTHKEEPEDDVSPKDTSESSAPVSGQNPSFTGHHKCSVDLIQEDFPRTTSPVYSQSHSSSLVAYEAVDHNINAILSNTSSLKISEAAEQNPGIPDVSNNLHVQEAHARERPSTHKDGSISNNIGSQVRVSIRGSSLARVESQYHASTQQEALGVQDQSVSQGIKQIHNNIENLLHSHVKPSLAEVQPSLHDPMHNSTFYAAGGYTAGGPPFYPNLQPTGLYYPHYGIGAFAFGSGFVPPFVAGYPSHSSINGPFGASLSSAGENMQLADGFQHLGKIYGQQGFVIQPSIDPQNMQYFHQPFGDAYKASALHNLFTINAASSQIDSFIAQNSPSTNVSDTKFQQATNGNFIAPHLGGVGFSGNSFYIGPSGMGVLPQFPASPLTSPVLPLSPVLSRQNSMSFLQGLSRNAGSFSGGHGQRGPRIFDDTKRQSFLEELKSSNAGKVELEDIAGRIVELSVDQHGSRFIQQKLEHCSVEEKLSVFKEVLPHSLKLMTDVFGNYVIQKFFEHGSPEQRKELADKLSGQMLHLSVQMYGCRVIQKALEVIELDQKTRLVQELDGHVIKCVHDQNGNHVIQKCIECVPAENIQFIISAFRGQVAELSTHPYGCRVIQRVLERCLDEAQSGFIIDEILESADILARDQYGNYVTQHVLERGKRDEKRQIICKLTGKFVQMSQHKYASNVIEKCLQYGDPADRDILIREIVGQSEGNDNLLIMMKDQFANYVVQKILEICNDEQKKTLLNSIRSHLQSLRKYTYGKHIVARVEKLCDGESQTLES